MAHTCRAKALAFLKPVNGDSGFQTMDTRCKFSNLLEKALFAGQVADNANRTRRQYS